MEPEKKDPIAVNSITGDDGNHKETKNDRHKWIASLEYILEYILKNEESEQAPRLIEELTERLRESGLKIPHTVSTPYINTIPPEKEPPYPGNREIERRIKSYARWNAMAMVVKANRLHADIGGHISTYASSATLYEVGHNHFFRGGDGEQSRRHGLFSRPRVTRRLRARLSRVAHQRAQTPSFSPGAIRRRRRFFVSSPVFDARFLAVSNRLDGPGADHVDLSGALSALPEEPRA